MSDNLADLGTVAVLSARQLKIGDYTSIDGMVCRVKEILDNKQVIWQPVVGWPLIVFRIGQWWKANKISLVLTVIIAVLIYLFHHFNLERFL